jgi:hypothetical protein
MHFTSQNYKIGSTFLIGITRGPISNLLLNRMAYYLRYVTRKRKVVRGVSMLQLVLT